MGWILKIVLLIASALLFGAWIHGTPGGAGFLLLVNGSDFLLLADNSSKLCLAGGC